MDITLRKINVLFIGSDMKIFEEGSDANRRMKEYGTLANRLDIAVYNGNIFMGSEDDAYKVSSNVFAYPRALWGLFSLFKIRTWRLSFVLNHKIDLVSPQDPFVFGFLGYAIARWLGVPLQLQVHTDLLSPYFRKESLKNRIYVFIAKYLLPRANGIRVVSNKIKESIVKEIKLKVEPEVLPIWINTETTKISQVKTDLRKKYPQFENIILMASRITVEKNISMAIEVVGNIIKKFNKTGLIIVGEGPLKKKFEEEVLNFGLEKNVIFEPWSDDLPSYYRTADIFLNTSNYEGYGRTIVEALAVGTPVITTDVGCAEEVIQNKKNGYIIPVNGKDELLDCLNEFIGDKKIKEEMKKAVKDIGLKLMSKNEYLDGYLKGWLDSLK
ncbi:MAG: glycosyltransferase [bacterium]